jgi:hypothetical protein
MAATYPDLVSAVVTFGSHPATLRDQDYPWGSSVEEHESLLAMLQTMTPEDITRILGMLAPREAADPSVAQWWRMLYLSAATPAETYEGIRSLGPVDIRRVPGSVQAPALVLHRNGDRRPTSRPAATWPSASPGPASWPCPATTTCPSSVTRTRWSS